MFRIHCATSPEYAKNRIPISMASGEKLVLPQLEKDFYLEIERPGYETQVISVVWGQELNRSFSVRKNSIKFGIEKFDGDKNTIDTQLAGYLFSAKEDSSLYVVGNTLEALKEQLEESNKFIEEHPEIQREYRTSLGLDFIISGSYDGP